MEDFKIENARIRSTMLGYEDHGIFTCQLFLDREIGSQAFGGYALAPTAKSSANMKGYGLAFIREILDVVGVDTWEELKGKHIRIAVGKTGWSAPIEGIGNYLKADWFYPKEFAKRYEEDNV